MTLRGLLFVFFLAQPLFAQPQLPPRDPQRPPAKGTAVIKGIVVDAQSGAPVRGATVRAAGAAAPQQPVAVDGEGQFEIRELPAGKYLVTALRTGYLPGSYGQRSPTTPGAPLELLDGQQVEKVRIAMWRGGVISGNVFDEYGEPAVGVQVQAMQYRYIGGTRQLVPTGMSGPIRTDDLGGFRLYGLPPGQYYVSARPMNMMQANVPAGGTGVMPTYYPNTADQAGAQRLNVVAGKEIGGINISLVTGRLARIRGRAVMSTGEPFAASYVSLTQREGNGMSSSSGGTVRPDGTFEVAGVTAGQYLISVRPQNARDGDDVEVARANVTVTGEDIEGLLLVGSRGAVVRGRVITDEGVPLPLEPRQLGVQIQPAPEERGMFMRGPVKDDYSFELKGVFGRGRLTAMTMGAPASVTSGVSGGGWSPKAVVWRDQDVGDRWLDFDAGQVMDDIQIVFSRTWSELSGLVVDDRNQPSTQTWLVLFPADESRWLPESPRIRLIRTDADGKYRLQRLYASEYLVAAVPDMEPGQQQDPEFLRTLVDTATRVSVLDGETKVQNLTVKRQ